MSNPPTPDRAALVRDLGVIAHDSFKGGDRYDESDYATVMRAAALLAADGERLAELEAEAATFALVRSVPA